MNIQFKVYSTNFELDNKVLKASDSFLDFNKQLNLSDPIDKLFYEYCLFKSGFGLISEINKTWIIDKFLKTERFEFISYSFMSFEFENKDKLILYAKPFYSLILERNNNIPFTEKEIDDLVYFLIRTDFIK